MKEFVFDPKPISLKDRWSEAKNKTLEYIKNNALLLSIIGIAAVIITYGSIEALRKIDALTAQVSLLTQEKTDAENKLAKSRENETILQARLDQIDAAEKEALAARKQLAVSQDGGIADSGYPEVFRRLAAVKAQGEGKILSIPELRLEAKKMQKLFGFERYGLKKAFRNMVSLVLAKTAEGKEILAVYLKRSDGTWHSEPQAVYAAGKRHKQFYEYKVAAVPVRIIDDPCPEGKDDPLYGSDLCPSQ